MLVYLLATGGPLRGVRVPLREGTPVALDRHLQDRGDKEGALVEAILREDGVHLRELRPNAGLAVNGAETVATVAKVGDSLAIAGHSVVVRSTGATNEATSLESVSSSALLSVRDVQTRGLASLFELIGQLREAAEGALEDVFATWCRTHLRSSQATLLESAAIPARVLAELREAPDSLVTSREKDKKTVYLLPRRNTDRYLRVVFDVGVDDEERGRLLIVATQLLDNAVAAARAQQVATLERTALRIAAAGTAPRFLGESAAAGRVRAHIERLASTEATVLILGESGVGKSFVARLIHEQSCRAAQPFLSVNCAGLAEALLDSELFGHEHGAFTGAAAQRQGFFEAAGAGTIFLDEIGDVSNAMQAKLLHVLEERSFRRLGSNTTRPLRARIILATNRDLKRRVAEGAFREDLFYRLGGISLVIPPLRERAEDIPLLAAQMLADVAGRMEHAPSRFSAAALVRMQRHAWPGNVRELRNVVEQAVVYGDQPEVEPGALPAIPPVDQANTSGSMGLPLHVDELERRNILAALERCEGNRTRVAALLGVSRSTLQRQLEKHGIDRPKTGQ